MKNSVAEPVPPRFVAEIVALLVPVAVAVPEIRPVELPKVSPAGKVVDEKLVGLLVAVIW